MKKALLFIVMFLSIHNVFAQMATFDIGLWGALSNYAGDMTVVDRPKSLGYAGGGFIRYNFNPRCAVRAGVSIGTINGYGEFDNSEWTFEKVISDVSAMYEFNFTPYKIGNTKHKIATYLLLGMGVSSFPYEFDYQKLTAAGAFTNPSDAVHNKEGKGLLAFNIPMGFGFKFNVGKRMSVGSEFVMRKYFSDKLDNLNDPRAYYNSETNEIEGYTSAIHNNDWTFHWGVTLCMQIFNLDKRCVIYE